MGSLDKKMFITVDALGQLMEKLCDLNDEDFSTTLTAFRFTAAVALQDGWSIEQLQEHLDDEWSICQQEDIDYRNSLN